MSDKPAKRGGFFGVFRRLGAATREAEPDVAQPAPPPPEEDVPELQPEAVAQEAPPPLVSAPPAPVAALEPETPVAAAELPKKQGWFQRLKAGLTKTSSRLTQDITDILRSGSSMPIHCRN
jgi:fused signal recognition particle receptor